jgi:hypothetical protein
VQWVRREGLKTENLLETNFLFYEVLRTLIEDIKNQQSDAVSDDGIESDKFIITLAEDGQNMVEAKGLMLVGRPMEEMAKSPKATRTSRSILAGMI